MSYSSELLLNVYHKGQEHGLNFSNYQLYKSYISNRIRRLRKRQNKQAEVDLELQMWIAERYFAHAMELKQINEEDVSESQRNKSFRRRRAVRKFGKAVQEAQKLDGMVAKTNDDRFKLESAAYLSFLTGVFKLENGDYSEALQQFSSSRNVYEKFSTVGSAENRDVYSTKTGEIDNFIRFCKYELKETGGVLDVDVLEVSEDSDLLKDKLEAILKEEKKKISDLAQSIQFGGEDITIQNDKIRLAILTGKKLRKDLDNSSSKSVESKLKIYDKLFMTYSDGMALAKDDMKKFSDKKLLKDIRLLHSFLNYNYLSGMIERNLLLIQQNRPQSPNDYANLYEVIVQYIDDIIDLPGIEADVNLVNRLEAEKVFYRAQKLTQVGLGYAVLNKNKEAYAFIIKSLELLETANAKLKPLGLLESEVAEHFKLLRQYQCKFLADCYLKVETPSPVTSEFKQPILDSLDSYPTIKPGVNPFIISFPPSFQDIPCKPFYFDKAGNSVDYPDLTKKEEKKGWFGLF